MGLYEHWDYIGNIVGIVKRELDFKLLAFCISTNSEKMRQDRLR